jgi:uncharacterized protein YjiS (DUF1127 family)
METAMSFYADTQTPSLLTRMVQFSVGIVTARLRALAQTVKNRRDASILTGLDDRMLADIGLTRGDIRDAYSEPVWRDPTAILVNRAEERRVNRRRTVTGFASKVFEAPSIVPALPKHISVNCIG